MQVDSRITLLSKIYIACFFSNGMCFNVILIFPRRLCMNLDLTVPVEISKEELRMKAVELQDIYVRMRKNGLNRASTAVHKQAAILGCSEQVIFRKYDGLSGAKVKCDVLDQKLMDAMSNPLIGKDGAIYPFIDIIGHSYFKFLA